MLHPWPVPMPDPNGACPCGRTGPAAKGARVLPWVQCCAPALADVRSIADAEALMRSRYTAFVLGRVDHLLATWHPSTRPAELTLDDGVKWLGLEVRRHRVLGADQAEVEFVARSRAAGRGQRLHEISRFVREDGQWYYLDGDVR